MASTLVFRLTGGASNSDPNASLGGIMSANALSSTPLNNLFDNVSPAEATAGDTEYRMIDVYNSGDATAESVELYVSSATTSAYSTLELGYDATANSHASGANLETLANESTAPASPVITFAERTSGSKLALPNIAVGQAVRIGVKRIITAGATNIANDTATLAVDFA